MDTTPTTATPPTIVNLDGFNLLALDGGGMKGVCSALIIQALNDKIKELQDDEDKQPHPADLFHLAAGTSTGGIIAMMLFRLRLEPDEVVQSYGDFGEAVFVPKIGKLKLKRLGPLGNWLANGYLWVKAVFGGARHASQDILDVIDNLVLRSKYPEDLESKGLSYLLKEGDCTPTQGKMLVCATKVDEAETVTFRNYRAPDKVVKEYENITIKDALCATTAAPLYMPRTVVNITGREKLKDNTDTFWDGGLLNNNPIFQVWAARFDLLPALNETDTTSTIPNVKTVVSIGCGRSSQPPSVPESGCMTGTLSSVVNYATNTWARHKDFERDIRRENLRKIPRQRTHYFRFEPEPVPQFPDDIDPGKVAIDDYRQLDSLTLLAKHWLAQKHVQEKLECCAKYLLNQKVQAKDCQCDACADPGVAPQVYQRVGTMPHGKTNGHATGQISGKLTGNVNGAK